MIAVLFLQLHGSNTPPSQKKNKIKLKKNKKHVRRTNNLAPNSFSFFSYFFLFHSRVANPWRHGVSAARAAARGGGGRGRWRTVPAGLRMMISTTPLYIFKYIHLFLVSFLFFFVFFLFSFSSIFGEKEMAMMNRYVVCLSALSVCLVAMSGCLPVRRAAV